MIMIMIMIINLVDSAIQATLLARHPRPIPYAGRKHGVFLGDRPTKEDSLE